MQADRVEASVSALLTVGYDSPDKEKLKVLYREVAESSHLCWQFLHVIGKKLSGTNSWAVAIKGILLLHQLVQDETPAVEREVAALILQAKNRIGPEIDLEMFCSKFLEKPGPVDEKRTALVKGYCFFLIQRMKCSLSVSLCRDKKEAVKEPSKSWKHLSSSDILRQITFLQHLLSCLVACVPDKALNPTSYFFLVDALELVLKDSFLLYSKVNYGIMELVERFEDLSREEAFASLAVYKRAAAQAEILTAFYRAFGELGIGKGVTFPSIVAMGDSYLESLQAYLAERGSEASGSPNPPSLQLVPYGQQKQKAEEQVWVKKAADQQFDDTWRALFGMDRYSAPVPPRSSMQANPQPTAGGGAQGSWELTLGQSGNQSQASRVFQSTQTGYNSRGGFDELLLRSLYETAEAQQQAFHTSVVSSNQADPFAASVKVPLPSYVQMAARAQQQLAMMLQQQLMARHLYYSFAMRGLPVPSEVQRALAGPYRSARNPDNIGVRYGHVLVPYS